MATRFSTKYLPRVIPTNTAQAVYDFLSQSVQWVDSIPSRTRGFTRKACMVDLDNPSLSNEVISETLRTVLSKIGYKLGTNFSILGIYLNYYRNGYEFAPSHNHPKQRQLIISLGATRTLIVGKKRYMLNSGDVILFGSSAHEVPVEPEVTEGRISIALFVLPL